MQVVKSRIILRKSGMILVEWVTGEGKAATLNRSWVSPSMIGSEEKGFALVDGPERGIPYGLDWSQIITPDIKPEDFNRELRRVGIWTAEDMQAAPQDALTAIRAVYRLDLPALLRAARSHVMEA